MHFWHPVNYYTHASVRNPSPCSNGAASDLRMDARQQTPVVAVPHGILKSPRERTGKGGGRAGKEAERGGSSVLIPGWYPGVSWNGAADRRVLTEDARHREEEALSTSTLTQLWGNHDALSTTTTGQSWWRVPQTEILSGTWLRGQHFLVSGKRVFSGEHAVDDLTYETHVPSALTASVSSNCPSHQL